MKRINHISAISLSSLLSLSMVVAGCSNEEDGPVANTDEVAFVASVPGVSSRAYDLAAKLLGSGFTVSAFCLENDAKADGILLPHFEDKTVTRQADGVFRSNKCKWPSNSGEKTGSLKFFAFHPSRDEMKARAGVGSECFIYSNSTVKANGSVDYDYWLTKFRVAPDISRQMDFVTAIGEGNKTDHVYSGIELAFEHQLCGVDISVWGASTLYDVEVAGVRVGGCVVEADFGLSTVVDGPVGDGNTIGEWVIPATPLIGHVSYVFSTGDKVVCINDKEHNTKDKASSIMGLGGKALLIPQKQDRWDHTKYKGSEVGGMYFSALIRMTEHEGDHHRIYPSTDPESQDHIVFLSVRKSDGTVMMRLDKNGNEYGTSTPYTIPPTEELRHYGWAAAPVKVEWKPGYNYYYVLDYSKGVGFHDPADPSPATPIVDYGGVELTTTNTLWGGGESIKTGDWGANTNGTAPDGTVWWK